MSETSKVVCDGCGKDITYTNNSVDYRLQLHTYSPEPWYRREGKRGGVLTDMGVYPAIDDDKHFCNNIECLRKWLETVS